MCIFYIICYGYITQFPLAFLVKSFAVGNFYIYLFLLVFFFFWGHLGTCAMTAFATLCPLPLSLLLPLPLPLLYSLLHSLCAFGNVIWSVCCCFNPFFLYCFIFVAPICCCCCFFGCCCCFSVNGTRNSRQAIIATTT